MHKTLLFFGGLLISIQSFCQLSIDFSGTFPGNWQGDTNYYFIEKGELKSAGPSSTSEISIELASGYAVDTEWEFYARLDFNPSSTNYVKFYLIADNPLKEPVNGYYIRIGGETGSSDRLELVRQDSINHIPLIIGRTGTVGKAINTVRVKVTRYLNGLWQLSSDTSGGFNFVEEGTATDTLYSESSYLGIKCIHTSTRSDKFFFDDIRVSSAPPVILNTLAISDTIIAITSNKQLFSNINLSSFSVSENSIKSVSYINDSVYLFLNNPLKSKDYSVSISGLISRMGELISDTSFNFQFVKPVLFGDILITEIFADPSPIVGLPEVEYLELYNNSSDTINLRGFILSDQTTNGKLPNYQFAPDQYLIISSLAISQENGNQISVQPWPGLNNSSDSISLLSADGKCIFAVHYYDSWHDDSEKKQGGWSLEMINPKEVCAGKKNWCSSKSPAGGTPGFENSRWSIISDTKGPEIEDYGIQNNLIYIKFDEPLEIKTKPTITFNQAISTYHYSPSKDTLWVSPSFDPTSNSYHVIELSEISDCLNNTTTATIEVLFPGQPDTTDLIINEILFNPRPYGKDFIEIYNTSDKHLDLKNWAIGSINKDGNLDQITIQYSIIIPPKSYKVFTESASIIKEQYIATASENLIEVKKLPAFGDQEGNVLLLYNERIMDRLIYHEDYHLPILSDKEGVSLERIYFNISSEEESNWHSTASTAGYATPGYKNSQSATFNESDKELNCYPDIFTPNSDGYNDFVNIRFNLHKTGYIGSVYLYDSKGRKIKQLVNNSTFSKETIFTWDGTTEENLKADPGIYILIAELFSLDGDTKSYKETVVLGTDFN